MKILGFLKFFGLAQRNPVVRERFFGLMLDYVEFDGQFGSSIII